MQAVLFCLSQNFEDVYRAEAIVICNSRGDCYANMHGNGGTLANSYVSQTLLLIPFSRI